MADAQLSLLPADPLNAWSGIQPRYRAYSRAQGSATPMDQLARDTVCWPGGNMTGFILWCGQRWAEWRALTGRTAPADLADHAAFDAWLEGR